MTPDEDSWTWADCPFLAKTWAEHAFLCLGPERQRLAGIIAARRPEDDLKIGGAELALGEIDRILGENLDVWQPDGAMAN